MARKPTRTFERYGAWWNSGTDAVQIELQCIKRWGKWKDPEGNECGLGLFHHIRALQKILWPWKQWHKWNEGLMLPELCRGGRLAVFGPASSGKSVEAVWFGLCMYYANPDKTTVLCSSTTNDSLNRRIFGYVKEFHKLAKEIYPDLPGCMIESKNMLVTDGKEVEGRNFKNGILGVALKKGGQWMGMEEFVGIKNDVIIMLADEVQFCPEGFWNSAANMEANGEHTIVVALGNLPDTFCPLAKAAEPKLGWDSLPESDKSRVYETRWYGGRAVQLIGMDSPNLDYPEDKEPFPKLIGRRFIRQSEHNYGKDTPLYHMFVSGKVPRGTLSRSVFTRSQCLKFHAMEQVVWGHDEIVRGYALDAAYKGVGGDRTCGVPFGFGKDSKGEWKFALLDSPKVYTGSDTEKLEHEDAIALQCRSECDRYHVEPAHVFFDGTGRSSLTIAFARLWSNAVVPIEFGGAASERPSFTGLRHFDGKNAGETKSCREVYHKFVTELCFAVAACIVFDQMRGMTEEIVEEGSRRLWNPVAGGKVEVEPKDDMRLRLGRSCDLADTVCAAVEGARRLGFPLGTTPPEAVKKSSYWFRAMRNNMDEANRSQELVTS